MESPETVLANLRSEIEAADTKEEKSKALRAYSEFQKSYFIEKYNICERLKKESSAVIEDSLAAQGISPSIASDIIAQAREQNVKRLIQKGPPSEEISEKLTKINRTEGLWTIGAGLAIIIFAFGLAYLFAFFSEDSAVASGSHRYSVLLPTGAFVSGLICIFRGLYKVLAS